MKARRITALVVLSVAVLAGLASPTPAHANHTSAYDGAHWSAYRWGNVTVPTVRAFWLFDRTGNQMMHQAIQQWVSSWNDQRSRTNPGAPIVSLYQDDASVGQCANWGLAAYSAASICAGDPGTTGVASLQWYGSSTGNHMVNPYVLIRPAGLNYGQLFTAVAHEMGHTLGLGHRPEVGVLMHANANFDGGLHWYDQHDLDGLRDLYGGHID